MKRDLFLLIFVISFKLILADYFPVPAYEITPNYYACYRTEEAIIIDGRMDEKAWQLAEWTDPFVDIEGDLKPKPFYNTQVKMLYDDEFFYFYAYLEDKDLWATLTKRDAVIFHDNDFEIFIDPDGDTHDYYELELNAFNTVWDLLVLKPYRDRAQVAVNAWDIQGLQTAVHLDGTINDNSDEDVGWGVEIAIPWVVLAECAHRDSPPKNEDIWRVNFSRVHYDLDKKGDSYEKRRDIETGKLLPEYNWVWSAQGLIAMHYPEQWGYVQFFDKGVADVLEQKPYQLSQTEIDKVLLRQIYYAQKQYYMNHKKYAKSLKELKFSYAYKKEDYLIEIYTSPHCYEVVLLNKKTGQRLFIFEDGRLLENREL